MTILLSVRILISEPTLISVTEVGTGSGTGAQQGPQNMIKPAKIRKAAKTVILLMSLSPSFIGN